MEDPKEVDDTLYIVEAAPRQIGRANAVKEWIAALEAQGKRVVVIGMDSPRPPLLGAAMVYYGNPNTMALLDYKTQRSLESMFPPEESKDAIFDRFMTSMMTPSREWLDPIPTQVKKTDWREDRMAFLNGIVGKKKHQK